MIHWMDSFMALFGLKRPEVWEAERKAEADFIEDVVFLRNIKSHEHDVTFPAPHAEVHEINFVAPRKRKVRSKRANVRSKRSQCAEGKSEK